MTDKPAPLILANPSAPIVVVFPPKPPPTPLETFNAQVNALRVKREALMGHKIVDRHTIRYYADGALLDFDYWVLEGGKWCADDERDLGLHDRLRLAESLQNAGAKLEFEYWALTKEAEATEKVPYFDRYNWAAHCNDLKRSVQAAQALGLNVMWMTYENAILKPQAALLAAHAEHRTVSEARALGKALE